MVIDPVPRNLNPCGQQQGANAEALSAAFTCGRTSAVFKWDAIPGFDLLIFDQMKLVAD
jgi:hypothetical protein